MFSFKKRGQAVEVQRVMRRIIDASGPAANLVAQDLRSDTRNGRTLPVLIYLSDADGEQGPFFGLSQDLSSQGLSIVFPQPLAAEHVIVGFGIDGEANLFAGSIRSSHRLGPFWVMGLRLEEVLAKGQRLELEEALHSFAAL